MNSVNKTIGFVICPFSGERSEVRENKNGKLYYVGSGGQITPNRPAGQAWLKANMQPLDDNEQEAVNAAPLEFGQRVVSEPAVPKRSEVKIETVSVTDPQPKQPEPTKKEESKKEADSWTLL